LPPDRIHQPGVLTAGSGGAAGAGGLGLAEFANVIQKQVHEYVLRKLQRSVSVASRCFRACPPPPSSPALLDGAVTWRRLKCACRAASRPLAPRKQHPICALEPALFALERGLLSEAS
jgi:hypothetical protein